MRASGNFNISDIVNHSVPT